MATAKLQNMWQKIAELEDVGFKRNYQLHYQFFKLNLPFSTLWLTKKDTVKYDKGPSIKDVSPEGEGGGYPQKETLGDGGRDPL